MGFPGSSAGKESACNVEDPSSIPRSGRFAGEGTGYPLQYSWASLVVHKNPPAMWETWVWSLDWEVSLEKGKATHSSILAWRIPWTVCIGHGIAKSRTQQSDFHFQRGALNELIHVKHLAKYLHKLGSHICYLLHFYKICVLGWMFIFPAKFIHWNLMPNVMALGGRALEGN